MRLARLYVILALVILASCEKPTKEDEATTSSSVRQEKRVENVEDAEEPDQPEDNDDTLKIQDPLDPKNAQLPILPPLILLDFGNDDDNSTSGDEKPKRTIDGNLGYGFARNNLFSGKNNYYFPAGKSGTTVSIEESISPFQPRTIIENVKPISEKPLAGDRNSGYGQNPLQQKPPQGTSGQQSSLQTVQGPNNQGPSVRYPQPIFGQRTKLYKPSQIDYSGYQGFSTTPKSAIESYTTARPDYRANAFAAGQSSFVTPRPSFSSGSFNSGFPQGSYTTQRPFNGYSTTASPSYLTSTPSYQPRYTANTANSFGTPRPSFDGITTPRPSNLGPARSPDSLLAPFSNLPRYTVENGVRYENKIVWKYSDGKISQTPPTSYVNAYNEFLSKQNVGAAPSASSYQNAPSYPNPGPSAGYQNAGAGANYQNFASQTSFQSPSYQGQFARYQSPQETRFPADNLGNIHSKSPAQFPTDQEPSEPSRPSQFVSSSSLQSANFGIGSRAPQAASPQQGPAYELDYRAHFGLKTAQHPGNPPSSSGLSSSYTTLRKDNTNLSKDSYEAAYGKEKLIPTYEVNSPNPEYTYTTESSLRSSTPSSSSLFTPSGTLSPNILSKYSTQAQKYLTKVFAPGKSTSEDYQRTVSASFPDQSYSTPSTPYVSTDYENLLNYNPSISQYIRNPSSILKAQPTYIQAGNSLIPVIILRVDGAPPIQPNVTPNINLKALLQQYLSQYTGSVGQDGSKHFDDARQNFGNNSNSQRSSLYELNQLAHSLSRYSQDPSIANSFAKQFEGSLSQSSYESSDSFPSRASYDGLEKTGVSGGASSYAARKKPQKVKSVQIIEDPRFTSYKVNG